MTWDVPERFNFTRDVVERLRGPALTFLAAQGAHRELGFEEVSARTARWAAVVRRAGVQHSDLFGMFVFFVRLGALRLKLMEIYPVRTIDEINDRQNKDRYLPV